MNRARSVCLLIAILLIAVSVYAIGDRESLDQLKQRAAGAHGGEQAKLCIKVAGLELQEVDTAYNAGDAEKGQAAVSEIVSYAEQATQAASSSHKDLKGTEKALRNLSSKLTEIGRRVSFEDRAPIKQAVDKIENLRTELLAVMFKSK